MNSSAAVPPRGFLARGDAGPPPDVRHQEAAVIDLIFPENRCVCGSIGTGQTCANPSCGEALWRRYFEYRAPDGRVMRHMARNISILEELPDDRVVVGFMDPKTGELVPSFGGQPVDRIDGGYVWFSDGQSPGRRIPERTLLRDGPWQADWVSASDALVLRLLDPRGHRSNKQRLRAFHTAGFLQMRPSRDPAGRTENEFRFRDLQHQEALRRAVAGENVEKLAASWGGDVEKRAPGGGAMSKNAQPHGRSRRKTEK
jgi:hypothetical protein